MALSGPLARRGAQRDPGGSGKRRNVASGPLSATQRAGPFAPQAACRPCPMRCIALRTSRSLRHKIFPVKVVPPEEVVL